MITITRTLARQFLAVCRRAGLTNNRFSKNQNVTFLGAADGLRVRVASPQIAIEYFLAGQYADEKLILPLAFLHTFDGRKPDAVTLDREPDGRFRANWVDRGVPQIVSYDNVLPKNEQPFPRVPENLLIGDQRLLSALDAAIQTCDATSTRYLVDHVQLSSNTGEIGATDGSHLLLQTGFQFPWLGEVLMPKTNVFRAPELQREMCVEIGRTEKHVSLRIGPWTVHLPIGEGKFPRVRDVIPDLASSRTSFRLDPADIEFLKSTLMRLPGGSGMNAPVTVECNGQLVIRAKSDDQRRPTELVLSRSAVQGEPLRISMDRRFLERALQLGFNTAHLFEAESPILCQDETRRYVWQALSKGADVGPDPANIRIDSTSQVTATRAAEPQPVAAPPAALPIPGHNRIKESIAMPHTSNGNGSQHNGTTVHTNGHSNADPATTNGHTETHGLEAVDPITAAESLKDVLRQALVGTNQLLVSLRRHKRQARLVQSTLASLKQLHDVAS